jgi:hypothetical protein
MIVFELTNPTNATMMSTFGFDRPTTVDALDTEFETLETMAIDIQAILFDHFLFDGPDPLALREPATEASGTGGTAA